MDWYNPFSSASKQQYRLRVEQRRLVAADAKDDHAQVIPGELEGDRARVAQALQTVNQAKAQVDRITTKLGTQAQQTGLDLTHAKKFLADYTSQLNAANKKLSEAEGAFKDTAAALRNLKAEAFSGVDGERKKEILQNLLTMSFNPGDEFVVAAKKTHPSLIQKWEEYASKQKGLTAKLLKIDTEIEQIQKVDIANLRVQNNHAQMVAATGSGLNLAIDTFNQTVGTYKDALVELRADLGDQKRISEAEASRQQAIALQAQQAEARARGVAGAAQTEINGTQDLVPSLLPSAK